MIQLFRPANPEVFAAEQHEKGVWLPKVVAILSTPGADPKVLLIKTPFHKLRVGEEGSWAPPQSAKLPQETIMAAARRILRKKTGLTKDIAEVRVLGYRNRGFQEGRPLPPKCPPQAQGWALLYVHLQIEKEVKVKPPSPDVASDCKFVAEGEYLELIRRASPAKQVMTSAAMVTSRVFPNISARI